MDTLGLTIEAVVACSQYNYAIGKDNTLPWVLPADLQRFKQITSGHAVVMGRRTAESIGRTLPNRFNIVLTRSGKAPYPGQVAVSDFAQAVREARRWADTQDGERKLFVIGGEGVYHESIPFLTGLHLTKVDVLVEKADAFWPMGRFIAHVPQWQLAEDPRGWTEVMDNGVATRYMHYQIDHTQQPDNWVGAHSPKGHS